MSRRVRSQRLHEAENALLRKGQPVQPAEQIISPEVSEQNNIPKGWTILRVADIGEVVTGKTPSTKKPEFWNGDIPFITPVDLNDGIITKAERTISEQGLAKVKELPRGSIAVSCIGYIGKAAFIDCFRSATNQQINSVMPSSEHDGFFLLYRFLSKKGQLEAAASITTVPILNKSNFESFPLSVPPLPEQKAIAAVLRTVQEVKEACDRVIAASRQLKQSLLQYLFTYGPVPFNQADQVPLKETEIGLMPEHWNSVNLGDVLTLVYRYPTYYNIDYVEEGIPEIRGELLKSDGKVETDKKMFRFISPETSNRFPRTQLEVGDIVMSVRGTMGKIGLVPASLSGANITANLIRLSPNKKRIFPEFLKLVLLSPRFLRRLDELSPQTTIKTIQAPVLKTIQVLCPPLPEQQEIAGQLSAVDAKITAEETRRDALSNLFLSLLHHLMTGKIRVTE